MPRTASWRRRPPARRCAPYTYDALGNLRRVEQPDGTLVDYVIDGRNRRVGKKVNGVLVLGWLYADQLRVVAELDGSGAVVSRFVYGSKSHVTDYIVQRGLLHARRAPSEKNGSRRPQSIGRPRNENRRHCFL